LHCGAAALSAEPLCRGTEAQESEGGQNQGRPLQFRARPRRIQLCEFERAESSGGAVYGLRP